MANFLKHLFWGFLVPVIGVTFVTFGSRFGMTFWPMHGYALQETMELVGVVLVSTFLLGSIYKYCDVVNRMEI